MKLLRMFAFRKGIKTSRFSISPVHFVILLTLAHREEGTHGYDILKLMKGGFQGGWVPKSGTLYPALDRLVKNGLVTKHEITQTEPVSSLKERTYHYTITDEGKSLIDEVLKKVPDPFRGIAPFFVYISRHAPPDFHQRFKESMSNRYGLWGRLWAGRILMKQFETQPQKTRDDELQQLESDKQQLKDELELIDKKLKKLQSET